VSCLRRLISSAACFTMRDSDRFSTLLCHDVDTRAAFARARFAYSLARSLLKFRPVVRTGSISLGGGARFRREPLYAIGLCDRPAMASRCSRNFLRIVKCDSRTTVWSVAGGVDRAQVFQIVHLVRLVGCDAVAAESDELRFILDRNDFQSSCAIKSKSVDAASAHQTPA
jgi:hypothetical protein